MSPAIEGRVSKCRVFTETDWAWFGALTAVRAAAIAAFAVHWFSHPAWWRADSFGYATLTFVIGVPLAGNMLRWASLPFMQRPLSRPPQPGYRVAAVTTCVPSAEPAEMVERTLQ